MDKFNKIILSLILFFLFIILCVVSTTKGDIIITCEDNTKETIQNNKTLYCDDKYYYNGMIIKNIRVPLEVPNFQ